MTCRAAVCMSCVPRVYLYNPALRWARWRRVIRRFATIARQDSRSSNSVVELVEVCGSWRCGLRWIAVVRCRSHSRRILRWHVNRVCAAAKHLSSAFTYYAPLHRDEQQLTLAILV